MRACVEIRARIEALEEENRREREENARLKEGLGREVRRETYLDDQKKIVLYGFSKLRVSKNMLPVALCAKDILNVIGGGNNYDEMDQEELV